MSAFAMSCVNSDTKQRPTFINIVKQFRRHLDEWRGYGDGGELQAGGGMPGQQGQGGGAGGPGSGSKNPFMNGQMGSAGQHHIQQQQAAQQA